MLTVLKAINPTEYSLGDNLRTQIPRHMGGTDRIYGVEVKKEKRWWVCLLSSSGFMEFKLFPTLKSEAFTE